MAHVQPRSDSFYRFIVFTGLLLALFALTWGRWALGQARERLFALDEQRVQSGIDVEEQRTEVARVEGYAGSLRHSIAAEKDHNSRHFFFLNDELDRTGKRIQRVRGELDRRKLRADLKSRQAALLQRQAEIDAGRSDGLAALGLTMTAAGFFLWYIRRQRHLDAEVRLSRLQAERSQEDRLYPWEEAAVWSDPNTGDIPDGSRVTAVATPEAR